MVMVDFDSADWKTQQKEYDRAWFSCFALDPNNSYQTKGAR